jgi:hypothetical protein
MWLLGCILIATSFIPLLKAQEIIKDKSPDRKFAMRIAKGEEDWEAAIIEVRTKKKVIDLEAYGSYAKDARLVWSKDSQRVAHFSPDRRGGTTAIYFRNGSKFEEVPLPEFPECDGKPSPEGDNKYLKATEATNWPEKWLKSGALVLRIHEEWLTESGASFRCNETVMIAFDASRKASVESVKDKKLERE